MKQRPFVIALGTIFADQRFSKLTEAAQFLAQSSLVVAQDLEE